MTTDTEQPYRVVDTHGQGWHLSLAADGTSTRYSADYGWKRDLPDGITYDQLTADRGPLRPVLAPTDAEVDAIEKAIDLAGRKAVLTIAAALEAIVHEARQQLIDQGTSVPASYEPSMRTVLAGREGSWESEYLKHLVFIGNSHNLAGPRGGDRSDVDAMRAAGPDNRVHRAARDQLADIFRAWTSSPDRYVEVAETLAGIVSAHADQRYGADGWKKIADQWLQPDARVPDNDLGACYRLLYSQSGHYDPDV
ncbi:hypothetical protein [Actinoplanes sp. NBRC 101535]|uniref:hypothetical protein n=1 Tax=Actinoplanes sp. NBRC 101535 TaxID=3032196 RepID=UPI00249FAB18|nr:hypothetical protein [Actinoplanes sp. NBRC 101535]GLY08229.1 hypothetical protein Acsp01_86080 [Actinoplanes sp. NBRC 101535]